MRFWEGKWEKMSHSQRFITSNLKLVFRSSDLFISFFVQFHSSLWKFPRHNSLLCLIQSLLHSITILCFSSGVLLSRLGMTLSNIYYFHFLIEVPSFISFPLYFSLIASFISLLAVFSCFCFFFYYDPYFPLRNLISLLVLSSRMLLDFLFYLYKQLQHRNGHACMHAKPLQACLILCDSTDFSPPDSSVHGILQARIQECVAMPSSRWSSRPRDWTRVSYVYSALAGGLFTTSATWEAPERALQTYQYQAGLG